MSRHYPVCPSCFDGMHSACTGNGCYCDCQLEDLGLPASKDQPLPNCDVYDVPF